MKLLVVILMFLNNNKYFCRNTIDLSHLEVLDFPPWCVNRLISYCNCKISQKLLGGLTEICYADILRCQSVDTDLSDFVDPLTFHPAPKTCII